MNTKQREQRSLPERIVEVFEEIDRDVCVRLRGENGDPEYMESFQAVNKILADFPILSKLKDDSGAISLSAEEQAANKELQNHDITINDIERASIYFQGLADCYALLKRIKAL